MNPIVRRFLPAALLIACAANHPDATPPTPATMRVMPAVAMGTSAPLRVTVEGREDEGVTVVTATVHVESRLPVGPTLLLHLPEGAVLVEGVVEENLQAQAAGTTTERRFRIKDRRGSVRVTADVLTAAMGAHAEAAWPEPPKAEAPTPALKRIAPITIRGVTVDTVVPLSPRPVVE